MPQANNTEFSSNQPMPNQPTKENPQDSREEKNIIHLDNKRNFFAWIKSIREKITSLFAKIAARFGILKQIKLSTKFERFKNKRILAITLAVCAVVFIAFFALFSILNKEEPLRQIYTSKPTQSITKRENSTKLQPIQAKELQNLIQKAALLYSNGQIAEALDIYDDIAVFSQSFAHFNLAVSKLKEQKYKDSIDIFNNVINSGDNVAAAAIDSAVGAYKLGDLRLFDYYVNLAKGTMIDWYDMPLYSYLYSIVNYYSNKYFNTLSSLKNPNSTFYKNENSILLSKMYLAFNDDYNALKTLLENNSTDNRFAIALLYARMGEYDRAIEQFNSLAKDSMSNPQMSMAQALIEIKRSNFSRVSHIYETLLENHTQANLQEIYPIKIKLQDSLFDVNEVQKYFWDRNSRQHLTINYKILFYFAPFRVFDINQAMLLIQEGGMHLKMDNIQEADNILSQGATLSRINANIAQSLKELLEYNIHNALEIMKQAALSYPNHQVLQYNLGLIYAQLNDFETAKKHFLKAYHLDENDIMAGIFALMCYQLTYSDGSRILSEVTHSFENAHFESPLQEGFLRSLFGYVNGNIADDMLWFDSKSNPMIYALRAVYSLNTRDKNIIEQTFGDLQRISNNDMVAMMLYRIVSHYDENIKLFSLHLFDFFKNDLKNLDLVYTGPSLCRQLYIYTAFLVGANSYVDALLTDKLLNTQDDISGILEALAFNAIYLGEFEKAFVYYNSLIDDYKLNTSENYFLAGVAAIGAGHYDNAVALIQLGRMEDNTNFEAKYALGLLHQAMGNFKLASLQFSQIGDVGFRSDFFDFEIDTSRILNQGE